MITALLAAAHLYVLPWKMLFMLPAPSEKPCAVTTLRYGPPDGKWESGSNPPASDCAFRVSVAPGPLLPAWADLPPNEAAELEVSYTVQGAAGPQTVSLKAEKLQPAAAGAGDFSAKASKVRNSVRVELTNKSEKLVLLGDATALRGRPKDDCFGPGPAAVLQPGETLIDVRPGVLSPSMKIFVSVFTGEKACRWVEVARKP
jgi:hypothetical protein